MPEVFVDLLEIASYVYSADQLVTRGGDGVQNVGEKWHRTFHFYIPVRKAEFWSSHHEVISEVLGFLTEDIFLFNFSEYKDPPKFTEYFPFGKGGKTDLEAQEVITFSGGLDSLGGAIQELLIEQHPTALVTHRSNPKISATTKSLLKEFDLKCEKVKPIHVPVWANKHPQGTETTQRTRSFLYASLAATVATMFGLSRIKFYENGVTSLNLPIADQITSSRATRSTHPRAINGFAELFSIMAEKEFKVELPFLWKTKTDVLTFIGANNCQDLIQFTRSCSHTIQATNEKPHCGECSQCVDRRFAALASGLEAYDPADYYRTDLLIGPREFGDDRTMLERLAGFAVDIDGITDVQFFSRYPQLAQIVNDIGGDCDATATDLLKLYRRHAGQVLSVIEAGHKQYAGDLVRNKLPDSCLLVQAAPKPQKEGLITTEIAENKTTAHSADFCSVMARGESYTFTSRQAQAVQLLWENWEEGTPEVSQHYILEELGSPNSRLRDSFKKSNAWGRLIVSGVRKGTIRLNL
jgi:hypothetical protein